MLHWANGTLPVGCQKHLHWTSKQSTGTGLHNSTLLILH